MSKSRFNIDLLFGALAFLVPLLLYGSTLCPTVPVGDGGELTCAAHSLGIAHPTGYPLFCLWGRVFIVALPLVSVAVRVNLMSAFFASLAILLVYVLAREIFGEIFKDEWFFSRPVALFTALIFGVSETMWSQAVQSEVYALHAFLVTALILVMVLWRRTADGRLALLWAFLWALSLANHTSVVFLLGVALYLAASNWRRTSLKQCLPGMALFFFLGISLYLYLPLRSALNPPHDWGNPETLSRLWDHISARQYRKFFLLASPPDVWNNLRHYVGLLTRQFGIVLLIFSLVGAVLQARRWRALFTVFLLAILGNVLLAASYDILDIEPYYLPSYVIFVLWLGLALAFGFRWLLSRQWSRGFLWIAPVLLTALTAVTLGTNFSRASQRGMTIARDYGLSILSSVEPNAILFTAADNETFPVMYLHDVEGVRPDVITFSTASTLERMRRFLGLTEVLAGEKPAQLRRMVVERTKRPVCFAKEHMSMGTYLQLGDLSFEPYGLVYRLQRGADRALEAQLPWSKFLKGELAGGSWQFQDYRARMMVANYHLSWGEDLWVRGDTMAAGEQFALARAEIASVDKAAIHNNMGVFFRRIGRFKLALSEFERALGCRQKTRADRSRVHANLGNLYGDLGKTDLAQSEMERSLAIWPENPPAQFNLARLRSNEALAAGLYDQAVLELEKMLALEPDNAAVCYNLGVIYGQRLRRPELAMVHLRRCLMITSQGPIADAAKVEIERLRELMEKQ
jgi:tetratricopeptide (TPR) repeat protein